MTGQHHDVRRVPRPRAGAATRAQTPPRASLLIFGMVMAASAAATAAYVLTHLLLA
jgi:hypothetical protein